jgi:hypothetical protein
MGHLANIVARTGPAEPARDGAGQDLSVEPHTIVRVTDQIVVRGAREHNLRNISLELPRDA